MADTYIDYHEASEYGRHFVRESATLETVADSPVDIPRLRQMVLTAVENVETWRRADHSEGSDLRGERGDVLAASTDLRALLQRFYHHLLSQPADAVFDMQAFFADANQGSLSKYKPADILAQCDDILAGFDSASNTAVPGGATWRADLEAGREALAQALDGKGGASGSTRATRRALVAARREFLRVYNRVAKRLVRGLLIHLDREHEYTRFFLDLQVSEGRPSEPDVEPESEPGADPATQNAI